MSLTVFSTGCLLTRPVSKSLFPSWVPPFSASRPLLCSPGFGAGNDLSVLQVHPHHHGAYPDLYPSSTPTCLTSLLQSCLRPHPSSSWSQDFPILHLDGIVEDSSNILGFSMFNTSHPFYPEFVRSLNMSWRENCEASTYPGPAVSKQIPTGT